MTVTALPRGAWQSLTQPIRGPLRKQRFRQGVVHWQGDGRYSTPADIAQHLRNMQAGYLASRGYSLGYGYAVVSDITHPQDGTRWEIRGTDINMASNPGAKLNQGNANDWTGSVLIIGPANKRVSAKAAEAIRTIFSEWHADAGTPPVNPIPHSALDYTTCCGPLYSADLDERRFDPTRQLPAPTPTPAPPTGDIRMIVPNSPIRIVDTRTWPGVKLKGTHTMTLPQELASVDAIMVTLAVVGAEGDGYASLWGSGPKPNASSINFQVGPHALANTTVTRVVGGKFNIHLSSAAHFVMDVAAHGSTL